MDGGEVTARRIKRLWLDARPGTKAPNAKLTDDAVRAILAAYATMPATPNGRGKLGIDALARRFGVSRSRISKVARGTAWRHVR